jgi:hypothetical protein
MPVPHFAKSCAQTDGRLGERMIEATFGHMNLIARDWRSIAALYERVFTWTCVTDPEGNILELQSRS